MPNRKAGASSSPCPSTYLRRLAIVVLLSGLVAASLIYFYAEPSPINPFDPMTSKRYIHDLGVYGGRFNVFAAELSQWFEGLWRGKTLAFTVGALSIGLAWLLWFLGTTPNSNQDVRK